MTPEEFLQLHSQVEDITLRDVHVGQVLAALVARMARSEGLDPDKLLAEQAKREAEPVAAPAEETPAKPEPGHSHTYREGKR